MWVRLLPSAGIAEDKTNPSSTQGQSDEKDQGWGPLLWSFVLDNQQPGQEILINLEPAPPGGHTKERQGASPHEIFQKLLPMASV